jgi:hypothetical protein
VPSIGASRTTIPTNRSSLPIRAFAAEKAADPGGCGLPVPGEGRLPVGALPSSSGKGSHGGVLNQAVRAPGEAGQGIALLALRAGPGVSVGATMTGPVAVMAGSRRRR